MKRQDFNPELVAIGTRIRIRREELGLTQQELADAVGTTRNTISRYEIGQSEMGLLLFSAISKALFISTSFLLTGVIGCTDDYYIQSNYLKLSERDRKVVINMTKAHIGEMLDHHE